MEAGGRVDEIERPEIRQVRPRKMGQTRRPSNEDDVDAIITLDPEGEGMEENNDNDDDNQGMANKGRARRRLPIPKLCVRRWRE